MTTAYTSLLGLALPVTGELSGTWGNTVNTEITSLLDSAIAGTTTISADADITLTTTTGAANESREAIILWTAAGTTTRNITAPAQSKAYIVINKSSSTQSIVLRGAGPTTGVTIIKGEAAVCAWNGTDFIKVSNTSGAGVFSSLTVTGTTTLSGLTASTALALDASKNVVSVTNTGTGNNVLSASPTLTGTVAGASLSLSSLTSGRVPYATTAGLLTDSANLLYSGTDLTVYGLTVGRGLGAVATNTAAGASALAANTSGANNTAVGYQAALSTTTPEGMTAVGSLAARTNTTGGSVTAVGHYALYSNTTGDSNTGVGRSALQTNSTGANNTAVGRDALISSTTAPNNTAVGYQAGYSYTTSGYITAIGYRAGYSSNAGGMTAIGANVLYNNTGNGNVGVGGEYFTVSNAALYANTSGASNTAVGVGALTANTTASNNTAVGYQAMYANTTGTNNTALGYQAMYANTTGQYCTAVGYGSLDANTTGLSNNAFGFDALGGVTTGSQNNGFGVDALKGVTTGTYNTAIGHGAGSLITTGGKNTIIGAYTGSAAPISATGSNYIVLSDGDGNVRQTIDSSGNVGIGGSLLINSPTAFENSATILQTFSSTVPAAEFSTAGGATTDVVGIWNRAASGDNQFIGFYTDASPTRRGSITYNRAGGLVAYNVTSDYRAKDIYGAIVDSGALIDSVPVYMGKMKDATQERPMFIAHETPVYAHTGEKDAVDADGNPVYQQMDASALIPVMWAEIQSLRKRLTALEST